MFFWRGTIAFLNENYILICICWMINATDLRWEGRANVSNSLFTIFLMTLSGGYLLHTCVFYRMNYYKLGN